MNDAGMRGPARLVPGLGVRAGQVLAGKYRVEELLGAGGSGAVFGAHHIHLRQAVTLKILAAYNDAQDDVVEKRVAKARQAARLRGEHVARILDIGTTEDGLPFVATERLAGRTLDAELAARGGKIRFDEAVRWVLEICEGLAEAHVAGIVHGDLKPHNVFFAERPQAQPLLKILDFGMASPIEAIGHGDESASAWFGSPAYLAPEQIREPHKADVRVDVWALGVLLFELIAGALPFSAETVSGVLVAVCFDSPPLLTEAPYELARLVHRCLEKDPGRRPRDVGELARALAPFAGPEGARMSNRISVALLRSADGTPAHTVDAAERRRIVDFLTHSIAPVHADVEPPPDELTRPSKRVRAARARARTVAAALTMTSALVVAASWAGIAFVSKVSGAPAKALPAFYQPSREFYVGTRLTYDGPEILAEAEPLSTTVSIEDLPTSTPAAASAPPRAAKRPAATKPRRHEDALPPAPPPRLPDASPLPNGLPATRDARESAEPPANLFNERK